VRILSLKKDLIPLEDSLLFLEKILDSP